MSRRMLLKMYAVCLGAAAMGVQILLLRQFMSIFYGNELIVGIVLAFWLVWVSLGSATGHFWWKKHAPHPGTFGGLLLLELFSTFIIYSAAKLVRLFFAVPYGEFPSFLHIVIFALCALALPAVLTGFLFSLLARLHRDLLHKDESAAFVYAYEAIGTVAVGLLWTFLPSSWGGLASLFFLGFLLFFALFITTRSKSILISLLLFTALLIPPLPHKIDTALLQKYWHTVDEAFELVDWRFTRFGQASLINWGGDKVLYFNGIKVAPLNNDIDNQALAATLLVQHPDPKRILIIEGNSSGLAVECAKFNLQVDVMELDRQMFVFAQSHMDSTAQKAWESDNIHLHFVDGRRALKTPSRLWDMIIVNVGAPTTALSNRYYTTSFFQRAQSSLTQTGVLALCHFPAGENFMGSELLTLNKIVLNTLQQQFDKVLVVPGDDATYFASNALSLEVSIPELERRYIEKSPALSHFNPAMLRYIYQADRLEDVSVRLQDFTEKRLNSDFRPVSYIFDFLLWHKIVRGHDDFIRLIYSVDLTLFLRGAVLFAALFLLGLYVFRPKTRKKIGIRTAAALVGFAGMTCTVILLLSFQALFGYVYAWIGVAMAAYMAGTAAASLWVQKYISAANTKRTLVYLYIIIIATLLLLLPMIKLCHLINSPIVYVILFVQAGVMVGAAFPLLCRVYTELSGDVELGSIYSADVLGGAVGAFLISSFLAPLYGFFYTMMITAGLCLGGVFFIIRLNTFNELN